MAKVRENNAILLLGALGIPSGRLGGIVVQKNGVIRGNVKNSKKIVNKKLDK